MSRIIGLTIKEPVKKGGKRAAQGAALAPDEKEKEHGEAGSAEAKAGNGR